MFRLKNAVKSFLDFIFGSDITGVVRMRKKHSHGRKVLKLRCET